MLSPFICINPHLHIQRETPATPPGMPAWAHNRPVKKLGVVASVLLNNKLSSMKKILRSIGMLYWHALLTVYWRALLALYSALLYCAI